MVHGTDRRQCRGDTWLAFTASLIALILQGCGGSGSAGGDATASPAAAPAHVQAVRLDEDSLYSGTVSAANPPGTVTFRITAQPAHGAVALSGSTGTFSYTPTADFFGTDSFAFSATDTTGASTFGSVRLDVGGVDDPPGISALPDASNSPDAYETVLPLLIREPDQEPLTVTASVVDTTIVEAVVDAPGRRLILRPKRSGASRVNVAVNDGHTTDSTSLTFTVQDVARSLVVHSSAPSSSAIVLTNTSSTTTDFELTHNGHHAFATMDQILDAIRNLADEVPAEPFERKLWRFIRDNTYHYPPVSGEGWMDAIWPTLNSFGWGFCSNVTSVFIQIAEAAGFEARAWGLNGHVVPEIRIGGSWQMYDPDLAVYYYRRDGVIASVTDLGADTTLITAPTSPLFAPGATAYDIVYNNPYLAGIYGTTDDNLLAWWYPSREPFHGSRITLPAGGRLIYPGRWTDNPIGYDGTTPYTVEQFRQARLEIPAGPAGSITVPWVLWDVQGTGTVRILGQDYSAGSAELRTRLLRPGAPITDLGIIDNASGLALIMLINPLWYDLLEQNALVLTGKDVWAIQPATVSLPLANRPPPPVPTALRKPQA